MRYGVKRSFIFGLLFLLVVWKVIGSAVYAAGESAGSVADTVYADVSPAEARDLIMETQDLVIVDVRTLRERKESALSGSIHVEMTTILEKGIDVSPDSPILLYCAVGGRSYMVGRVLASRGFKTIYNLKGGIKAWQKQGYEIVREESRATLPDDSVTVKP